MHSQFVNAEVECGQVELVEDLIERHGALLCVIEDDHITACLHLLLDKAQQVLLVHARSGVDVRVHFAHIVEVSVWHRFLLTDLLELVEHTMKLELGLQVMQTPVAEGLPIKTNHAS